MEHLHRELDPRAVDVVVVTLDDPANVLLLDPPDYDADRQDRSYRYHGGHAGTSPVRLVAPDDGKWHVVVDLGGYAGRVRAGVGVLRGEGVAR